MIRTETSGFLTKLFMVSGVVAFVLIDAVMLFAFWKNPRSSLFVTQLDVYLTCVIASAPLYAGVRGFFIVKKLMLSPNENNTNALKTLTHLFSLGIIAAYWSVVAVLMLMLKLHR